MLTKWTSAAQRAFPGCRSMAAEFVQLVNNVCFQRPGLVANGTWLPMAAVHFAAGTGALLASWMAARAKG